MGELQLVSSRTVLDSRAFNPINSAENFRSLLVGSRRVRSVARTWQAKVGAQYHWTKLFWYMFFFFRRTGSAGFLHGGLDSSETRARLRRNLKNEHEFSARCARAIGNRRRRQLFFQYF